MPRYAMLIEYDGGPFSGWQRQDNVPSVQGAIEDALRVLQPEFSSIFAAGRTDAGVHATAQVAHCDLDKNWDPERILGALNYHLKPAPVAIVDCAEVDEDFHARFSANERRYLFRLLSRKAPATHDRGLVWQIRHKLDLSLMKSAAKHLIGRHDFTTFRATHCQAQSPVKTLDEVTITEVPVSHGVEYQFRFRARSFLHNQVRGMVGTLERVGAGSMTPLDVKDALNAPDRAKCGPVCPSDGLYLAGVGYENDPFKGNSDHS